MIKWKDGKVDREAMRRAPARVTPTGEYADALDECVSAMRFVHGHCWTWPEHMKDDANKIAKTLRKIGVEP